MQAGQAQALFDQMTCMVCSKSSIRFLLRILLIHDKRYTTSENPNTKFDINGIIGTVVLEIVRENRQAFPVSSPGRSRVFPVFYLELTCANMSAHAMPGPSRAVVKLVGSSPPLYSFVLRPFLLWLKIMRDATCVTPSRNSLDPGMAWRCRCSYPKRSTRDPCTPAWHAWIATAT